MTVSIALCTFNGSAHLQAQLDSLAAQSRLPDELVLSDDASTDDTLDIARAFRDRAPFPVHLHRQPQSLGPTRHFQHALSLCSGDILLPCDQDDRWHPTKLQTQLAPFSDPAVTFSIVNSNICNPDLSPRGTTVFDDQRFTATYQSQVRAGEGYRAYLRHLVAAGHAMAFRRDVLRVAGRFPDTCVYDQWLALVASMMGQTWLTSEPLVDYRYHARQVTGGQQKTLADWSAAQGKLKLDHLQRNFDTHALLRDRLQSESIPAERLNLLDDKLRFLGHRLQLRKGRLTRTAIATRLLLTGQYHRLGRGWLTFLRDFKG
jgi:glycosyltransferase involved in cell wall biosynthesis